MKNIRKNTSHHSFVTRFFAQLLPSLTRPAFLILICAGLALGLIITPEALLPAGFAQQKNQIGAEAMSQIEALLREKESRTTAQRKIDSQLIYAMRIKSGKSVAPGVENQAVDIPVDDLGAPVVDITAQVDEKLMEALAANGARVLSSFPRYRSIRAAVPFDRLEAIAALSQVIFIQPRQDGAGAGNMSATDETVNRWQAVLSPSFPVRAERVRSKLMAVLPGLQKQPLAPQDGSVNSQGDGAHKADLARSTFGANGAGVRIGVMSDGVNTLATSQSTGDLGPVTILRGQSGNGNEGTAMLEIVHDIAPGAELYYAAAQNGLASMAQNVRDLRAAGCDIIIDDWTFFVEGPFHNGQAPGIVSNTNLALVVEAVNEVTADGCLYFSDAANAGNKNDGTSGTVESDFVSGGSMALVPGGNVHDFDPGAGVVQYNTISNPGSGATNPPLALHWADPLGASNNDYDLFVLNPAGDTVLASATNIQSGTQDPVEQIAAAGVNVVNNRIVVLQKTGAADRFFHLNLYRGRLLFNTPGETRGHNAIGGHPNHFGVAASNAAAGAPYTSANVVEPFSSDGPRRIFFNRDQTPITPGNLSSTGGSVLQKPDITAADGVSTTAPGFTTFFGTSAAAPHAGAIAGLLKSQFPSITPTQVRTALIASAIDIEAPGVDRDSGAGIVMAFEAMQSLGAVPSANFELVSATATETCCNSNGVIEPSEGAALDVQLMNSGAINATGISATLTTSTPGVLISNGASAYPDTASPSGTSTNTTPFRFSLAQSYDCDMPVDFTMTLSYMGGNGPKVVRFSVPLIVRQSITTTLDATAPLTTVDYPVAATGTQTGRLNRFSPTGACNFVEASPGVLPPGTGARQYDAYTFTNPTPYATCATVTYTTPCSGSSAAALFAVAYSGSFDPANITNNYLSDSGSSPTANIPSGFSFNVPAGGTVVVVVHEVNPGGGVGCAYTLQVGGMCKSAPTAAPAGISGRVLTADGAPLEGVTMQLSGARSSSVITDAAGNYEFENVDVEQFYTVTPSRVNYHFNPGSLSFSLQANKTDAGFTAIPDAVIVGNAIDTAEYFVRQHYLDFLGREPDESGFNFWSDQIVSCGDDAACVERKRINVSAAYFLSIEFQRTGGLVDRLYRASFGRAPKYAEFMPDTTAMAREIVVGRGDWEGQLLANQRTFVESFVERAAFRAEYGGLTNTDFIDKLIGNTGVSNSERDAIVDSMRNGATRADVLLRIAEHEAFVGREAK